LEEDVVRLLIADADASVREIIGYCAKEEGWMCDEAKDGIAAIKLLRHAQYHLLIMEAELPIINGKMVYNQLSEGRRPPVIFISNKTAEADRLAAFNAGGNDYVLKPFFPREIVARIKNLLHLYQISAKNHKTLDVGDLKIDLSAHTVLVDGRRIKLTPKEYTLLLLLCQYPHRAFSRDSLLNHVWGQEFSGTDRTVDTHIKSLREKIKPHQDYIATIWGFGYKLNSPQEK